MDYFKCFNTRKLINKNRYKSLIEALNEISDINPLNEYPAKENEEDFNAFLFHGFPN